jgi:hypothetical protein
MKTKVIYQNILKEEVIISYHEVFFNDIKNEYLDAKMSVSTSNNNNIQITDELQKNAFALKNV